MRMVGRANASAGPVEAAGDLPRPSQGSRKSSARSLGQAEIDGYQEGGRMHANPLPREDAVASTVRGPCADSRHSTAHRVAAAVVKPPALRRMAVRVELLGLGTGLTARDKVSDAEPW